MLQNAMNFIEFGIMLTNLECCVEKSGQWSVRKARKEKKHTSPSGERCKWKGLSQVSKISSPNNFTPTQQFTTDDMQTYDDSGTISQLAKYLQVSIKNTTNTLQSQSPQIWQDSYPSHNLFYIIKSTYHKNLLQAFYHLKLSHQLTLIKTKNASTLRDSNAQSHKLTEQLQAYQRTLMQPFFKIAKLFIQLPKAAEILKTKEQEHLQAFFSKLKEYPPKQQEQGKECIQEIFRTSRVVQNSVSLQRQQESPKGEEIILQRRYGQSYSNTPKKKEEAKENDDNRSKLMVSPNRKLSDNWRKCQRVLQPKENEESGGRRQPRLSNSFYDVIQSQVSTQKKYKLYSKVKKASSEAYDSDSEEEREETDISMVHKRQHSLMQSYRSSIVFQESQDPPRRKSLAAGGNFNEEERRIYRMVGIVALFIALGCLLML